MATDTDVDFDVHVERAAKAVFAEALGWRDKPGAVDIAWKAANQEWYRNVIRRQVSRMIANGAN